MSLDRKSTLLRGFILEKTRIAQRKDLLCGKFRGALGLEEVLQLLVHQSTKQGKEVDA